MDNWFLTLNHAGVVIDNAPAIGTLWTIAPFGERTRFTIEVCGIVIEENGDESVIIWDDRIKRDETIGARQWWLMQPCYVGTAKEVC